MYNVVPAAKTRCADVIFGADQNTSSHPTYRGWRTKRYGPGVRKPIPVYERPNKRSQTWRSPKRSKWLMRKVVMSTVSQPHTYRAFRASRPGPASTFQITPPMGCHFQNISSTAAQL